MKKTVSILVVSGGMVFALACGGDSVLAPSKGLSIVNGQNSSDTTVTSTGPVTSLTVSPRQLRMTRGNSTVVSAVGRDAAGAYVPSAHAGWQTRNSAIVTVSDEGRVTAVANGAAWVVATLATTTDSAQVIVSDTPQDTVVVIAQPAGIASYDLTVKVVGALTVGDTTQTQAASGVVLTVTRTSDAQGRAITPVVAGTATTDATGSASIRGIAGGNFTVAAVPPAGSAYRSSTVSIGAPLTSAATVNILLVRNP